MIDTGRLSLSHAIQSLRPAGPQRKKWKCDENPELASQLDGLLRFVVAWKKDLVLSPRGYSADGSRRRRGCHVDSPWRRVAVWPRRG